MYGVKTIDSTELENFRIVICQCVEYVLKCVYDMLSSETEYVRVNIIVIANDEHRTVEPFRLSEYKLSNAVQLLVNKLFDKYSDYDVTGVYKVVIIGKRFDG